MAESNYRVVLSNKKSDFRVNFETAANDEVVLDKIADWIANTPEVVLHRFDYVWCKHKVKSESGRFLSKIICIVENKDDLTYLKVTWPDFFYYCERMLI